MDSRTVLIAERGRSLVPPGQTVLEREHVGIVAATTGEEVLADLRKFRPRLLIVGPDLPDMPIAELCRRIRADPETRAISILLVVSVVERGRASDALAAGANALVFRPIEAAEFDRQVGALLSVPTRKELRVLVQLRVEDSREGFFFLGHTRNLSVSGLLLETDHPLEVGRAMGLRFFLPGRPQELTAVAEVVRERNAAFGLRQFGLRFRKVSEADKIAIAEFVARRSVSEIARERRAAEKPEAAG
jgi:CheY-like chemotaxis protein